MENEASKLVSPWCNSLENSEWIAENVKGLDQRVKQMLQLILHGGDFSSGKPRCDHTELIACVEEISHKHHLLMDHYNKSTPHKKLGMQAKVDPSELSLSSGGGISDTTPIEGSDSSLLSSDSDSESCNSSPSGKILISDYEKELKLSKEKLEFAEEEIARLKSQQQNNDALIAKIASLEAQVMLAQNQIKLQEAEMVEENKRSLMLHRQIVELEAELESEKARVHESINKYTEEIQKLNGEIQDAFANFALEKWQLESSVFKLSERTNQLQNQCELLEAEKADIVRKQEALKGSWQDNIERMNVELREKTAMVDTSNENLDKLKQKYDMLAAEKDGLVAELQTLSADLSAANDQIQCLDRSLNESRCENELLSSRANKFTAELKSRIEELEEEVRMQAVMISDTAEEKREAIRQLCFSLEHFRSAYQEMSSYAISKRPKAMVS